MRNLYMKWGCTTTCFETNKINRGVMKLSMEASGQHGFAAEVTSAECMTMLTVDFFSCTDHWNEGTRHGEDGVGSQFRSHVGAN